MLLDVCVARFYVIKSERGITAESAVEQVRALDEERVRIVAAAKAEAIKKVERALKELSQLGFNYRLAANAVNTP